MEGGAEGVGRGRREGGAGGRGSCTRTERRVNMALERAALEREGLRKHARRLGDYVLLHRALQAHLFLFYWRMDSAARDDCGVSAGRINMS